MNKIFKTNHHNVYHLVDFIGEKGGALIIFNKRNKRKRIYFFKKIFLKEVYEKSVNTPFGLLPPKIKYYFIKIFHAKPHRTPTRETIRRLASR